MCLEKYIYKYPDKNNIIKLVIKDISIIKIKKLQKTKYIGIHNLQKIFLMLKLYIIKKLRNSNFVTSNTITNQICSS